MKLALHAKRPLDRVWQDLVRNVAGGRGSRFCLSQIAPDRNAAGFDAAICQKRSFVNIGELLRIDGRAQLGRVSRTANIVEDHVIRHSKPATDRCGSTLARRISKADTRCEILVRRPGSVELKQT